MLELDELRRQWQQAEPADAPAPLDAAALARLLAQGSRSPVGRMRRNAWLEIGFVLLTLVGCVALLLVQHDRFYLAMAGWLALICLLSGFYFRRKLAVLRSLADASGRAVREHVAQQLHSLRSLVRLYYQATMWSIPVSLSISIGFLGARVAQQLTGPKMLFGLGVLSGLYVLLGGVLFWGMGRFTTWYLQTLYGKHLDRLEASLRELSEEQAAVPR